MNLQQAIAFQRVKKEVPDANKAQLQNAFATQFPCHRVRSVFVTDHYAIRFSEARTGSFSNTVLSLSALRLHDTRPFVVAAVRQRSIDLLLANATFLRKISHSSHQLRIDNIKGSFNGTDIMTSYEGIPNSPENFDELFAQHQEFTWDENLARLVEATTLIVGRDTRFHPTEAQIAVLMAAPERAAAALEADAFRAVDEELRSRVAAHRAAILAAAEVDNVNLRGNAIEQLLTENANVHELGDLTRDLDGGLLVVDIKTKLLDRASAPKAYNVDKMLAFLSEPGSVLAFMMIEVDIHEGSVAGRLVPALEASLLNATRVQHHWAGRSSRGVTQLSGQFRRSADPDYELHVDVDRARDFLTHLLAL